MKYYIGQNASFSKTISETDVYLFAGISGDFNPVHVNKIEAEKTLKSVLIQYVITLR